MITPDWPAPSCIVAGTTQSHGGVSQGPYASNNLALHVGDDPQHVLHNRGALDQALPGKKQWQWLEQVHGTDVVNAPTGKTEVADACYTTQANVVCTVLTADCLPVLLCDKAGSEIAAIHAGWRSLCGGIIEHTTGRFNARPEDIMAWFGPAIGPQQFEVGIDVLQAFRRANCGAESEQAFLPVPACKYLADIYQLATIRLNSVGVYAIYGDKLCTVTDRENYYSFRRDGMTGRMASFIYRRL